MKGNLDALNERLDKIIQLLAYEYVDQDATIKENVEALHPFGFSNERLAQLIGTTEKTVAARKSELRDEGRID